MDYREVNKKTWNEKTDVHIASDFYKMDDFRAGKTTLKEIELPLLGDVKGKTVLHLQCHFGQDTMSLSRMGAKATGIDISDKAIQRAKEIAKEVKLDTKFICCDIYDTPKHITEKFDIVFTSYGTIIWFPDLDKWAEVIASSLKPGGKLVFADFHPVVWMFDDDFRKIKYSYFNIEPIAETVTGTYADRTAEIIDHTVTWNHALTEVLQALLKQGLQLTQFHEHNFAPFSCFKNVEEYESGRWRIKNLKNRIPMVYALEAAKL